MPAAIRQIQNGQSHPLPQRLVTEMLDALPVPKPRLQLGSCIKVSYECVTVLNLASDTFDLNTGYRKRMESDCFGTVNV